MSPSLNHAALLAFCLSPHCRHVPFFSGNIQFSFAEYDPSIWRNVHEYGSYHNCRFSSSLQDNPESPKLFVENVDFPTQRGGGAFTFGVVTIYQHALNGPACAFACQECHKFLGVSETPCQLLNQEQHDRIFEPVVASRSDVVQ